MNKQSKESVESQVAIQTEQLNRIRAIMSELQATQGWNFLVNWASVEIEALTSALRSSEDMVQIYRLQGKLDMLKRVLLVPVNAYEIQKLKVADATKELERIEERKNRAIPLP